MLGINNANMYQSLSLPNPLAGLTQQQGLFGSNQNSLLGLNSLFGSSTFDSGLTSGLTGVNLGDDRYGTDVFNPWQNLIGFISDLLGPEKTTSPFLGLDSSLFGNSSPGISLEEFLDGVEISTSATGDPHFGIGGKQAFDFQGKDKGTYKLLENQDISFNAKFAGSAEEGARVSTDQNLEFKGTGINVVSHAGGKFEIFQNGQKIGDQTNYNTDAKVKDALKKSNIDLTFANNDLTTKYKNRTIVQKLNAGNVDNTQDTLMKGDTGLLSQTVGANDTDRDGKANGLVDVNKDGKVDNNDVLNYDAASQYMVYTAAEATSCKAITPEIEAAIKKDIAEGAKQGAVIKGFSEGHGYDARQWNEYVGGKLYTVETDKYLA